MLARARIEVSVELKLRVGPERFVEQRRRLNFVSPAPDVWTLER